MPSWKFEDKKLRRVIRCQYLKKEPLVFLNQNAEIKACRSFDENIIKI